MFLRTLDALGPSEVSTPRRPCSIKTGSSGGRTGWAHFEFTRTNIERIILRKQFEELREAGRHADMSLAYFSVKK